MTLSLRRAGRMAVVALPLAMLGACAQYGDEDRALVQRSASNSEQALAESRAARQAADQALAAARQAQAAAQAAQAEARAANEKVDRMTNRRLRK